MRWRPRPKPSPGSERYRREFLWLPKRIGVEWRWLEVARWMEVWESDIPGSHLGRYGWRPVKWMP